MFLQIDRAERIVRDLKAAITSFPIVISDIEYAIGKERPTQWRKFPINAYWGDESMWYWFKTKLTIPEACDQKAVNIALKTGREGQWDGLNPQFLVYVNGRETQALDTNHTDIILKKKANAGDEYLIEFWAFTGNGTKFGDDCKMCVHPYRLDFNLCMYIHDYETERAYFNLLTAQLIAKMMDSCDQPKYEIHEYLVKAMNLLDLRQLYSAEYNQSLIKCNQFMEKEFYGKYCGHQDIIMNCVAHTHIDVAWLWTIEITRQKAVRSFTTVLKYMDEYPDYIFMASQPQLYQYVKEDAPEVYERIKQRIQEGRWEAEGAMWLEADCNLASGESLIRQIIHGKQFYKNEFGKDSKILWLPDVFGYSASLPQILKKTGVDTFITSKISWNEYNHFPYDTFLWQGIDGTQIFTQFLLGGTNDAQYRKNQRYIATYGAQINPNSVAGGWDLYQQKDISHETVMSYGFGDGGGGPTRTDIEIEKRLSKGVPGVPKTQCVSINEAIRRIKEQVKDKKIPKWVGELYLEFHRGTYTSMARNKRSNRKCEFLMQKNEMISIINQLLLKEEYPNESFRRDWETILLNQFHDIIPGSSIEEVYDITKLEYEAITKGEEDIFAQKFDAICQNISETGLVVFNPTGYVRSDYVEYGDRQIFAENIPSYGWKVICPEQNKEKKLVVTKTKMENDFYCIKLNSKGNLISIFDKKENRELIQKNQCANVFQVFEDKPENNDNWNIDMTFDEKMWEVEDVAEIKVLEQNSQIATLGITKRFLSSTVQQKISIYRHSPRIDFDTVVDWKENELLLKVAFPMDIMTEKASYEIQYGAVERPTHKNTSWDHARFEVCAHKWADISESGYGVALINDCKYGYDIMDSTIRLTLIKCGMYPNPNADRERHYFTYSLYAHKNTWHDGDVVKQAYYLNCPMHVGVAKGKGNLPSHFSLVSCDRENAVITVVKQAEKGQDMVIRLYESEGKRSMVNLHSSIAIDTVRETDMLEEETYEEFMHDKYDFQFLLKPYEIKTFVIKNKIAT